MSKTFHLEVVTPQGKVFAGPVEHLRAPGIEGSFGVLPGHTPFMTPLQIGLVELTEEGRVRRMAISGGFIGTVCFSAPRKLLAHRSDGGFVDIGFGER